MWAIDTITGLTPAAPDGATSVVIAVDVFTKWAEMHTVPDLNSTETAKWFYNHIITGYGAPAVVRTDQGTEYQGAFDA